MAPTVVPFAEGHLDAAADVYVAVFNAAPWHDRWTAATARERLADILATPGALGFALLDREFLGFVLGFTEPWYDGAHFYLKEMCVQTGRQRMGLGSRPLQHLEQALREQGIQRVYLLTAREGPAQAFYAKHGYYTSPKMCLMAHRLDLGDPSGR